MDIVFAADDNYAAYLCVAAKSVEAAHPDTEIRFHVLDAGISEANRAAVAANLRGGGVNFGFIELTPKVFPGYPLNLGNFTITSFPPVNLGNKIPV
ncbi:glycosyltransferase family 8 protein, partial [Neisseria gonorrhoeae]